MKLKQCSICLKETLLWKSNPATCYSCRLKKPVKKVSDKRQSQNELYKSLRQEYLILNPDCQAKFRGCEGKSVEIHHRFSGKDRDTHFLDTSTWWGICRSCHDKGHNLSKKEAIQLNFKL